MLASRWEAGVAGPKDATSRSSPASPAVSLASFPPFSQGTELDGRRSRPGMGRSSEAWLSVSSVSVSPSGVWATSGGAGGTSRPEGAAPRGLSLFSSLRINRESATPLEQARFLGDGGRCLPCRALSSWPQCQSAWSPDPLPRTARLSSLGALDLFWKERQPSQTLYAQVTLTPGVAATVRT